MGPLFQVCTLLSWLSGPHTALFIKIVISFVVFPHFLLHFVISLSLILHLHVEKGQWEMKRLIYSAEQLLEGSGTSLSFIENL